MDGEALGGGALRVAFGPVAPGWGSWDWVGADTAAALAAAFRVELFEGWDYPECDVAIVVKHSPPAGWVGRMSRHARVIYAPVDAYGSAAEIDGDAAWLRSCARIVIHCERLRRYFAPYASVEYLDHHVKFASPQGEEPGSDGNVLWVGVRSNLPPLVGWVNDHHRRLPAPLDVLTNLEDPLHPPSPAELGFRGGVDVRVHEWSRERQLEMTARALAALDIKGEDFRSRHKPPAKAIDFIASGVPLAMNVDSSPVDHLSRMGFDIASPSDPERWLSPSYREEVRRFGAALRELLSPARVAGRWERLIRDVGGSR